VTSPAQFEKAAVDGARNTMHASKSAATGW
jgi:hypothetical protein